MLSIDKINVLLQKHGMTGADLSRAISVSNSVYSQWNTRATKPSNKNLKKIADYFGVSVEELLDDPDEDNKKTATDRDGKIDGTVISERTAYANKIFAMLNTTNQLEAINQLLSLLQNQVTQDGQTKSD